MVIVEIFKGSKKVHGDESRRDLLVVLKSGEDRKDTVSEVAEVAYPAT